MEESTNKKISISQLSNLALKIIQKNGYCWTSCDFKNIAELSFFYNQIDEEIKRRKMMRPQTHALVGKFFMIDVMGKKLYFGVNQWLPVIDGTKELAEKHNLHGFINASGFMIEQECLMPKRHKVTRICTNSNYHQDDNQFGEVPQITVGTDELGLIVSSRIFDDEDENERILAEEISQEEFTKYSDLFKELNFL